MADVGLISRNGAEPQAASPEQPAARGLSAVRNSITDRFVDVSSSDSVSTRFRARRWRLLIEQFPNLPEMTVLDLGGTVDSWRLCPTRPAHLTLLNGFGQDSPDAEVIVGDACDPPAALQTRRFDLVFSNSVLEHVGGHWRRLRFAETVNAHGDHHWLQTPYRYFPVEPHFLCPLLQYLPLAAAARTAVHWPVGNYAGRLDSTEEATRALQDIELLGLAEMRRYFPDSAIRYERAGPFIKSLIAVR
ncbi:MAG TPA: class I SAM-dependent methyltransferase [Solirubrobacteraceae bacterium]|jgi:hypothetical protein|nr:class I SAM-dependent methyltransferase [Solirubrobacteraceae bacterium]